MYGLVCYILATRFNPSELTIMTDPASTPLPLPLQLSFKTAKAGLKTQHVAVTAHLGPSVCVVVQRDGDVAVFAPPGMVVKRRRGKDFHEHPTLYTSAFPYGFDVWGVKVIMPGENELEVHSDGRINVERRPASGQPWLKGAPLIREVAAAQLRQSRR